MGNEPILRIILTILCAFVLGVLLGKVYIPMLRALKAGQSIREIGPSWHSGKNGKIGRASCRERV